jgi:lysophospholipase L1-like esterase
VNIRFPVLAARAAAAEARGDRFLVVLAGSSTTAGSGASSRRRTSYAATLSRAVRSPHPRARFANHGVGGTTAATYLPDTVCDAIAAQAPAAVIHMVGGNDYARGVAPAAYGEALRDRLDRIDAATALPCQHVLVHTFARPDVQEPAAPWSAFRAELDTAVEGHTNRAVIDVSAAFDAVGVGLHGTDPLGLLAKDGIHPGDGGHRLLGRLVAGALLA